MRLPVLALLAAGLVRAQYFSEGWTPGQTVPTEAATTSLEEFKPALTAAPTATPAAKWSWKEFSSKHLDLGRIMTEGPIATALSGE
jgi:hypothetical protein